jgi:ABC-2 type transport system ATP-binding protein
MKNSIISINNLSFKLPKKKEFLFEKLNLEVSENSVFGLIGPNGSGKTTLIKLILGLQKITSGEISFLGKSGTCKLTETNKQQIGLVSGATSKLFVGLTLNEHFQMYKNIFINFDESFFMSQLAIHNLYDRLTSRSSQLSFGERIKFETLLTIAYNPKVLFLDEPTVGLDIIAIDQIRQMVKEFSLRDGKVIFLTSHNLEDMSFLADRIGFLKDQKIETFDGSNSQKSLEQEYRRLFK